jgi:NADPH:quinone reductase-like Zn-dependent oxidoreductase
VHAPLEAHLAATYASTPFDVFMDTVGVYALYVRSPTFTKRTAMYLNVGALNGPLKNVAFMVKATLWPSLLGGTPRKYVFQNTVCRVDVADELVRLVDEGKLKILVDEVFDMAEALMVSGADLRNMSHTDELQAYDRIASKRATGKVMVKIQDL